MKEKGKEGKEVRSEEGGWGLGSAVMGTMGRAQGRLWFRRAAGLMRGHDPGRQIFEVSFTLIRSVHNLHQRAKS